MFNPHLSHTVLENNKWETVFGESQLKQSEETNIQWQGERLKPFTCDNTLLKPSCFENIAQDVNKISHPLSLHGSYKQVQCYVKIMHGVHSYKQPSNITQNKINCSTNLGEFSNTAFITFNNQESSTDTEFVCAK